MPIIYGIILGVALHATMFSPAHAQIAAVRPLLAGWVINAAIELPVQEGDDCVEVLHHLRDARKHRFVAMEAVPSGLAIGTAKILLTTQRNSRRRPETSIVSCNLDVEDVVLQSQALSLNQVAGGPLPWIAVAVQLRGVNFALAQQTGCAEGLTMLRQNRLKVMDKAILGVTTEEVLVPHTVYYLEEQGGKRKTALLVCQ